MMERGSSFSPEEDQNLDGEHSVIPFKKEEFQFDPDDWNKLMLSLYDTKLSNEERKNVIQSVKIEMGRGGNQSVEDVLQKKLEEMNAEHSPAFVDPVDRKGESGVRINETAVSGDAERLSMVADFVAAENFASVEDLDRIAKARKEAKEHAEGDEQSLAA